MFESARLKLTAYYLLIIMTISTVFSVVVYHGLTTEISRGMRLQALRNMATRSEELFFDPLGRNRNNPPDFHIQTFEEAKKRVAFELLFINVGIIFISGAAGYFLAGKTLKPIAEMVEDQKRFIADASHELRTPLTAIKTETEVLLRDKNLDLKNAKETLISNIEEIDKLKSLTDYFLTLSQYQNDQTHFIFESVDLAKLIDSVCVRMQSLFKTKEITIVKNYKETIIEANKTSLIELITILLDNALKYSHEKSSINIIIDTKKNSVFIKIEDFGIGIKASDLPHIFNRFYRADLSRTKNNIKGYGLGLAIAKSIVDLHHGTIKVESLPDKGSIFTILLPTKHN